MIETLWRTYAGTWSLGDPERMTVLATCLRPDVTYCDPSSNIAGADNLSAYMADFQSSFPGARFEIQSAHEHDARTLARWHLMRADDTVAMQGISFARLDRDGKMQEITGFFEDGQ